MDRIPSVYLLPAFLAFVLLHSILLVEPRSLKDSGNEIFQSNKDADIQNRIIDFLLRKNIIADQEDVIGLELTRKLVELQELEALGDVLDSERQLASRAMEKEKYSPGKRGEPCFWKYCV